MAASIIKISRKTLNDYNRCINLGKLYGFDFDNHYYDKMGVLRQFIKNN